MDTEVLVWYVVPGEVPDGDLEQLAASSGESLGSVHPDGAGSSSRQRVLSRVLVRAALSARAGVPMRSWTFERDAHGRPHVVGPVRGIGFSLSHAEGLLVCATAPRITIGVDTEAWSRGVDVNGIAALCCSAEEQRWIESLAPFARQRNLLHLWTLKEAYLKALGCGISPGRAREASFRIRESEVPTLHAPASAGWSFQTFSVRATHAVSIAWEGAALSSEPHPLPIARLVVRVRNGDREL